MIFLQARRNAAKLVGEQSSSFDLARGRLVLLSGVFVLAYMLVTARAVDLTIIQGNVTRVADGEISNDDVAPAAIQRGDITDRNGVLLATTLKMASLYADPHFISDVKLAAQNLAKIFPDLSSDDLLQKFQGGKRFIRLRRDLTQVDQYKVLELGEPGLTFQDEDRRIYPQGPLTAHLVGYAGVDNTGLAGVERGLNDRLDDGKPLRLTIDVRLQHALRRETLRAMKEFNAIGAAGVILDARNGDVLAGVSLPDFDPRVAGEASDAQTFNRLTLGTYELGSVFKIFSVAAYLESHNAPMSASFDASQPLKSGAFTIADYDAENRILTIPEVFMYSSNIGAALMGEAVGGEKLKNFYDKLGLLKPMSFEIPEVARPQVPNPWRDVNTLTASFGHGISTTPLQLASAVASIANGGMLVRPRLVMQDTAEDKQSDERVVSAETAHRMRQLMRLVVTDGTGEKAEVPGYDLGGKTGTAEKNSNGHYDHNRLISSFVGAFPIDAPRYVVYIMIDEPKGTPQTHGYATAGWTAAPAVARVVTSMAAILGIPPKKVDADQDISTSLKQYVSAKAHE